MFIWIWYALDDARYFRNIFFVYVVRVFFFSALFLAFCVLCIVDVKGNVCTIIDYYTGSAKNKCKISQTMHV